MIVEIKYDNDRVVASDDKGNEVYYRKVGNDLKVLFASYNGIDYDKIELGWKRSKRGAVSKDFYEWYEAFDKLVYKKHYQLEETMTGEIEMELTTEIHITAEEYDRLSDKEKEFYKHTH